ncbi:hypothetical protein Micbo1qcDRAFT_216705 [Microdochium bolleyi]|uniref:Uncharacterized protein n=1 Tax=Microdochium bolleyi TaxID=196109 RepID=A0A136JD60_9PEZI|nr:hypothetical protein Micbo1qcDRAFT_216705 [Microdochium bolleyi]
MELGNVLPDSSSSSHNASRLGSIISKFEMLDAVSTTDTASTRAQSAPSAPKSILRDSRFARGAQAPSTSRHAIEISPYHVNPPAQQFQASQGYGSPQSIKNDSQGRPQRASNSLSEPWNSKQPLKPTPSELHHKNADRSGKQLDQEQVHESELEKVQNPPSELDNMINWRDLLETDARKRWSGEEHLDIFAMANSRDNPRKSVDVDPFWVDTAKTTQHPKMKQILPSKLQRPSVADLRKSFEHDTKKEPRPISPHMPTLTGFHCATESERQSEILPRGQRSSMETGNPNNFDATNPRSYSDVSMDLYLRANGFSPDFQDVHNVVNPKDLCDLKWAVLLPGKVYQTGTITRYMRPEAAGF